jgi:tetratricopeptide (TPR) repeat protein
LKARQFIPLLVVAAGVVAYSNSFRGVFVLDDRDSIEDNPTVHHLWPLGQVLSPPRRGGITVEGRPLINLSLAINYAFSGDNPWGYHAVNLAIHLLAGLTLLGIVRRTLLQPGPIRSGPGLRERFGDAADGLALATALIWTVHPLQTESVTYIVQRAESIMGLFYLLTLYCFIRGSGSHRPGLWYGLSWTACALGMASKEVMVSAPLVVLFYDRAFIAGSFREAWNRRWLVYLALASTWVLLGYLLVSAGSFMNNAENVAVSLHVPWWQYALSAQYALTQPGVILHYLRLALWPDPLCFDYGGQFGWPAAQSVRDAFLPLIVVVALLAATLWACWRRPALGFLGIWFFIILAPTSSVLPVADRVFEHRMYLSLAAVVTLVTVGGFEVGRRVLGARGTSGRIVAGSAVGLVTLGLAALTIRRNEVYRSELVLWQDTIAKCPNNPRAHNNLGLALFEAGRIQEAVVQYEQALRINPESAEAHNNLAFALFKLGRVPEALDHFQQAIRVKPNYAEAHYNLGLALSEIGRYPEAIGQYQEVLRSYPDHAPAHNNLGVSLLKRGDIPQAIQHYEAALRINPEYTSAQNNLAWLLATLAPAEGGDPARALTLARRACLSTSNQVPAYLDTLAASYAAAGRFEDAVETARKAVTLCRSTGQLELAQAIQNRLELYRRGHAYVTTRS